MSGAPDGRVLAGTAAAAAVSVVTWILQIRWNITVPQDVASAMTVVLVFGASYGVHLVKLLLDRRLSPPAPEKT